MNRKSIIWIAVIAVIVYLGYVLIPMYYKHQMMILEVEGQIKIADQYDEDELLEHMIAKAEEWELPINPDFIIVDRRSGDIRITINYHVDKKFFNYYEHRFKFLIRESGKIQDD